MQQASVSPPRGATPKICDICKKTLSVDGCVRCSTCGAEFHSTCITKYRPQKKLPNNVPQVEIEMWYCTTCERNLEISIDNENTIIIIERDGKSKCNTVRTGDDSSEERKESTNNSQEDKPRSSDSSGYSDTDESTLDNTTDVPTQIQNIYDKYGTMKDRHAILKSKVKLQKYKLQSLYETCSKVEQNELLNDIEILGVPYTPNENLLMILTHTTNKLGVYVSEFDVDYIRRVSLSFSRAATHFDPRETMHKPIVVKFARRLMKIKILSAWNTMRPITTEHIVNCEPNEIGIYERLVEPKQELFRELYYRTKLYKFNHCWVLDGDIYLQKEQDSEPILVDSRLYMDRYIGLATPPPK